MIIHAGDLTYKGLRSEVIDFLDWFSSLKYAYKIFIAGNHDFYFEKSKAIEIEQLIPAGVTYLNDSGVMIEGINVWGSPVTPWFYNWAFNRKRGPQIRKHWGLVPEATDVLITHGPAFGMHDDVINGEHVGCKDLMKTIEKIQPKVHVCGHIHESYGITRRSEIKYINACVLNERYELANAPLLFDL